MSRYFDDQVRLFEEEAKAATVRLAALVSLDFTQHLREKLFKMEWEAGASMVESLDSTLAGPLPVLPAAAWNKTK